MNEDSKTIKADEPGVIELLCSHCGLKVGHQSWCFNARIAELKAELGQLRGEMSQVKRIMWPSVALGLRFVLSVEQCQKLTELLIDAPKPLAVVDGYIPIDIDTDRMWDGSGGLFVLKDDSTLSSPQEVTVTVYPKKDTT